MGIVGCTVIGVSFLTCIFNPLFHPRSLTTVSTKRLTITADNDGSKSILDYNQRVWPKLEHVYWRGMRYTCNGGRCLEVNTGLQANPMPPTVSYQEITIKTTVIQRKIWKEIHRSNIDSNLFSTQTTPPSDSEPPPTAAGLGESSQIEPLPTVLDLDGSKNEAEPHPSAFDLDKVNPLQTLTLDKPVPTASKMTPTIKVQVEEFTVKSTVTSYVMTSSSPGKIKSKTVKKMLDDFFTDVQELLIAALGSVFSVGTLYFGVKMVYKYRYRLACMKNEITADVVNEGMRLFHNALDVSVQTETSMIEDEDEEKKDRKTPNAPNLTPLPHLGEPSDLSASAPDLTISMDETVLMHPVDNPEESPVDNPAETFKKVVIQEPLRKSERQIKQKKCDVCV